MEACDVASKKLTLEILRQFLMPVQKKVWKPKETVTEIMMLYESTKVKVHSLDGDTDFFNIVADVLQVPYLFIICLVYILRPSIDLMKENRFTLKKDKKQTISRSNSYGCRLSRWHSASCKYTYPSRIPAA